MNIKAREEILDFFRTGFYSYIQDYIDFMEKITLMTHKEFLLKYGRKGHIDIHTKDKGKIRIHFETMPNIVILNFAEKIR